MGCTVYMITRNRIFAMQRYNSKDSKKSSIVEFQPIIKNFNRTDILLGRGAFCINHIGNVMFRDYCFEYKETYNSTTNRTTKNTIVEMVLSAIFSKGGRFLSAATDEELKEAELPHWQRGWIIADHISIVLKIKQLLREKTYIPKVKAAMRLSPVSIPYPARESFENEFGQHSISTFAGAYTSDPSIGHDRYCENPENTNALGTPEDHSGSIGEFLRSINRSTDTDSACQALDSTYRVGPAATEVTSQQSQLLSEHLQGRPIRKRSDRQDTDSLRDSYNINPYDQHGIANYDYGRHVSQNDTDTYSAFARRPRAVDASNRMETIGTSDSIFNNQSLLNFHNRYAFGNDIYSTNVPAFMQQPSNRPVVPRWNEFIANSYDMTSTDPYCDVPTTHGQSTNSSTHEPYYAFSEQQNPTIDQLTWLLSKTNQGQQPPTTDLDKKMSPKKRK